MAAQSNSSFKETQIRPDELMGQHAVYLEEDIVFLAKFRSSFVNVPCPACDEKEHTPIFEKNGVPFSSCVYCETVYANPRPSPEILKTYYQNSKHYSFWNTHIFPASEEIRRERIFRVRVNRLADIMKKYHLSGGSILEIGAGFGTFCEELRSAALFQRVLALEPTPAGAESCRKRGLEVIEDTIENLHSSDYSLDVIASFEVIEHLFNPSQILKKCYELLKSNGLLFLTCPNVKGLDIEILGTASSAIDNEHINLFHPVSMRQLLRRNGFKVLEITTPGKLDIELVRKAVESGKHHVGKNTFLEKLLGEQWETLAAPFQDFLAERGLSSSMQIVAQKI